MVLNTKFTKLYFDFLLWLVYYNGNGIEAIDPRCDSLDYPGIKYSKHPSAVYVPASDSCLVVELSGQTCNRFPGGRYAIINNSNRSQIDGIISAKLATEHNGRVWGYRVSNRQNLGLHFNSARELVWGFNNGGSVPANDAALDQSGLQSDCPVFTRGHGHNDAFITDDATHIGGCENLYTLCQYPPKKLKVVLKTSRIQMDINECASSPCANGGQCVDGINKYSCNCLPGFTGLRCKTNINECASNPCANGGHCVDGVNKYSCNCLPGFTDPRCKTDINECASNPCANAGHCVDEVNKYSCNCLPGFTGPRCEININECASIPCANGGRCVDRVNKYTCNCLNGFTGSNCETRSCVCVHGMCNNVTGTCACVAGWTGDSCDKIGYTTGLVNPTCTNGVCVCPTIPAMLNGIQYLNDKTCQVKVASTCDAANGGCTNGKCPAKCAGLSSCPIAETACAKFKTDLVALAGGATVRTLMEPGSCSCFAYIGITNIGWAGANAFCGKANSRMAWFCDGNIFQSLKDIDIKFFSEGFMGGLQFGNPTKSDENWWWIDAREKAICAAPLRNDIPWYRGEPNDFPPGPRERGHEDCLAIKLYSGSDPGVNDYQCKQPNVGILCERDCHSDTPSPLQWPLTRLSRTPSATLHMPPPHCPTNPNNYLFEPVNYILNNNVTLSSIPR